MFFDILKIIFAIFMGVVIVAWIIGLVNYNPKDKKCPYDCDFCPFPCDQRKD